MNNRVLVVGGMGVAAGKDFHATLAKAGVNVVGRTDTEHPCRVAYLEGRGPSPCPSLAETIGQASEGIGFDEWVMACNTAHSVYSELRDTLPGSLASKGTHLISNTINKVDTSGLLWLGTTVLGHSTKLVRKGGIMLPGDMDQLVVQDAIWEAKAGRFPYSAVIREIVGDYTPVAGCTEMPLILRAAGIKSFVNPAEMLAA